MNECQICSREEDLKACDKCKRHTCTSCLETMKKQGYPHEECSYCGFRWYEAPKDVEPVIEYDDEVVPVQNPYIGIAQEDSFNMETIAADRYTRQLNYALAERDIQPGDLVTQENTMGEVQPFTLPTVAEISFKQQLMNDLKGETFSMARIRATPLMERDDAPHVSTVRRWLKDWTEEGWCIFKPRGYEGRHMWYMRTDQEFEDEQRQFIDSEPELNQFWNRDMALNHMEFNITLKDASSDQPFDLTGCNVFWGHIMGEMTDEQEGQVRFFVTKHDARDLRTAPIRIQRNGSQWLINIPQFEREMLERMDIDPFERAGNMIMGHDPVRLPEEVYDSSTDWQYQLVKFALGLGGLSILAIITILLGLL